MESVWPPLTFPLWSWWAGWLLLKIRLARLHSKKYKNIFTFFFLDICPVNLSSVPLKHINSFLGADVAVTHSVSRCPSGASFLHAADVWWRGWRGKRLGKTHRARGRPSSPCRQWQRLPGAWWEHSTTGAKLGCRWGTCSNTCRQGEKSLVQATLVEKQKRD